MKHRSHASSLPDEQAAPLPATVAKIGKIHFEGNIIPQPVVPADHAGVR